MMRYLVILAVPIVACVSIIAGCLSQNATVPPTTQQTHNVALDNAIVTIDTAAKELTAAKKAGFITRGSDVDHKISAALHAADDAFVAYHSGTASGASNFSVAASAFWKVFADVEPLIVKGK